MYELHAEANRRDNQFSDKIEYDRFNPPWLHGRVVLLLPSKEHGSRILNPSVLTAPCVPTVHALDKNRTRPLAAAILSLWIERENHSRERLLWYLAKENEVFTVHDNDLLSLVDGAVEADRPMMVARRMTANLADSQRGERDIIEHTSYRLTCPEVHTLKPLRMPCAAVVDAFMSLLDDDENIILSSTFVNNLSIKSSATMLAWPIPKDRLLTASNILVPLHTDSNGHWALVVVSRHSYFVDIYDSLPHMQIFMPLYPLICRWANSIRGLEGAGDGWSASHRIHERKEVCIEQFFGVDASIFMMGHSYNVSSFVDNDGVYPRHICMLRREIRDAILTKKITFSTPSRRALLIRNDIRFE